MGICKLCQKESDLRESHIIPKFAFRYLKNTSPTGNLRSSNIPNRRIQDGPKPRFLCQDCEELLSDLETWFTRAIFHPFLEDGSSSLPYTNKLIRFSTSLSWRVLTYYQDEADLDHFDDTEVDEANRARERWRRFLLSEVDHPDEYEQHIMPVSYVKSVEGGVAPGGLNFYLMRSVDMDCLRNKAGGLIVTKLPGFFFVGFTRKPSRNRWQGTRISLKKGVVSLDGAQIPGEFGQYIEKHVAVVGKAICDLSPTQQRKVSDAYENLPPGEFSRSKMAEAIQSDIDLSGTSFFVRDSDSDEE